MSFILDDLSISGINSEEKKSIPLLIWYILNIEKIYIIFSKWKNCIVRDK